MNELEEQYIKMLVSIAKDKGLLELASYIERYGKDIEVKVDPIIKQKYNITQMPEATCDGCQ